MNDLAIASHVTDDERTQIATMTDVDQLVAMLHDALLTSVKKLAIAALCWRRLDELNVKVDIDPRVKVADYLKRIAYGQLLPEIVVMLGDRRVIDNAVRLPIPDQRAIVDGTPFKVMDEHGDHRNVQALDLTPDEIKQVFDKGRVRSEAEQVGWLKGQLQKKAAKNRPPANSGCHVNRRTKKLEVDGRVELTIDELLRYAQELSR